MILLIAGAVLAQTSGAGQTLGQTKAALAPAGVSTPAQAERAFIPSTNGAEHIAVNRSQAKRDAARPIDAPPLFLPAVDYSYSGYPGFSASVAARGASLDS
ncbi:MAG: hypothetical protein WAU58_19775, partial [Terriglobales bacterium]